MISEIIEKWIKGILIDGITGNLSGLFDNVNAKVGEIASDIGSTPQASTSCAMRLQLVITVLSLTTACRPLDEPWIRQTIWRCMPRR